MKRIFIFLTLIFLILSVFQIPAQEKSRVAVLPFTAVEASAGEARVVSSLFETALVKTGVYNVIEQNQITEILDAQAFSLAGCTDDACAVEVGKLLAAELIILGELSNVGGRYIATAKIIDVGMGRNVNADSVSAVDIVEMTDTAVNLLAYKLAGLTYTEGGDEIIAESFGEIYIATEPDGAAIFINGMRRGTSPLVVDRVPFGTVRITAQKGNSAAEEVLKVSSSDLIELSMVLEISLGRLFIKSSVKDVEVFLDGQSLGPLAGGLFKNVPSGEHTLTLKGEGLIWEEKIVLEAEKTTTIEAYPRAFGSLSYVMPEGAECELSGNGILQRLTGTGTVDLAVGRYTCTVFGDIYVTLDTTVEIARGQEVVFSPTPDFTEEYESVLADQQAMDMKAYLESEVERLEAMIASGDTDSQTVYEEAKNIFSEIKVSGFNFPYLKQRIQNILISVIESRIDELEALAERAEKSEGKLKGWRWIGFGTGAAALSIAGASKLLGDAEYETYLSATTTDVSQNSHRKLSLYAALQLGGLIAGGAGTVTGILMTVLNPNPAKYRSEIELLSEELSSLEGGIQ